MPGAPKIKGKPKPTLFKHHTTEVSAKLVHRVVFATSLECSVTGKILLVVITNIGTRHDLVFHTGDTVANLLALHMQHVTQHTQLTEVLFRQGGV